MKTKDLNEFLRNKLKPDNYEDYCPNGIQIEGKEEIKKIAFAVSATRESIKGAITFNADALIVHHGVFWKFHGCRAITGSFYKRVAPLIKNDINLFAYHLPLDGNIEFGNAASIAQRLNLKNVQPFGLYKNSTTGVWGEFQEALEPEELKKSIKHIMDHEVITSVPIDPKKIKSLGIITGGANSEWKEALRLGLDAYLTGEMSEHDYHEAGEDNIFMLAAGHNATEKFGIQNLMRIIQLEYPKIECLFIDSNNPA